MNQSASEEMLQSAREEMVILVSPPVPFRRGVSDDRGDIVRMALGFVPGDAETGVRTNPAASIGDMLGSINGRVMASRMAEMLEMILMWWGLARFKVTKKMVMS